MVKVRLGFSNPLRALACFKKKKFISSKRSHGSGTISVLVIETDLSLDASSGNYEEPAVIQFFNDVREYMKAGSSASAFKVISLHKETPAAPTEAEG